MAISLPPQSSSTPSPSSHDQTHNHLHHAAASASSTSPHGSVPSPLSPLKDPLPSTNSQFQSQPPIHQQQQNPQQQTQVPQVNNPIPTPNTIMSSSSVVIPTGSVPNPMDAFLKEDKKDVDVTLSPNAVTSTSESMVWSSTAGTGTTAATGSAPMPAPKRVMHGTTPNMNPIGSTPMNTSMNPSSRMNTTNVNPSMKSNNGPPRIAASGGIKHNVFYQKSTKQSSS